MNKKVNEYESWSKPKLVELLKNIDENYEELIADGKREWVEEQKRLIKARLAK